MDKYEIKEDKFSDKWGVYKFLTEVQGDIKEDITSDFILAKLNDFQKESVIELVRDAYFIKREIEKYSECHTYKVDKFGRYIKEKDGRYKKYKLEDTEINYIKNVAKMTFNHIMIKILMTNIEYRNIDKNILIELIAEKDKMTTENKNMEDENKELLSTIKKNIKKGDKQNE